MLFYNVELAFCNILESFFASLPILPNDLINLPNTFLVVSLTDEIVL